MTCADLGSRKILPAAVWRAVHSSQDWFGGRAGRLRRGAAVGLTELGPGRAAELGGGGKTFGFLATQRSWASRTQDRARGNDSGSETHHPISPGALGYCRVAKVDIHHSPKACLRFTGLSCLKLEKGMETCPTSL